ncbi:phage repressor protein CI [Pantoea cypripedii]|uniref:Repressor n=1 Tax=Pantoea cypripedii TaxID=55209 RepID=A0A1X1EZ27_PANCY|nr:phage repressor protein CI [Pantoea cypripedii]MBP2195257.1 phage repressor protein C with HTH and peptisase S24 domain [Pantoea cypripedii]ORM95103.1 repressor [Pantoea cypripedii]
MPKLQIDMTGDSTPILDRVIEAYGFAKKIMLADHLGIASSSLAGRYKRDLFPADIVVRCMAETGATLEWLATGNGHKFDESESQATNIIRKKLVNGIILDDKSVYFDESLYSHLKEAPIQPFLLLDEASQFIIDTSFNEIEDGDWLVEIEGKTNIRTLTRIPVRRVHVSSSGIAFDCAIDEIKVIGRIALTIK